MSVFQAQPTFIFVGIYGTSEDFQRHQNCRKFKICWKKVVVGKQLKASFIKEFSLQAKQTKCRHVNSTAQGLQDEDNSCGIASSLPAGYPIFFCSWQRSNGVFLTTVTALKRSSHQDWRSAGRALLCMGMAAIEGFRLRQVPPNFMLKPTSDVLGHQFFRRPRSAVLHYSSCFRKSGISCG